MNLALVTIKVFSEQNTDLAWINIKIPRWVSHLKNELEIVGHLINPCLHDDCQACISSALQSGDRDLEVRIGDDPANIENNPVCYRFGDPYVDRHESAMCPQSLCGRYITIQRMSSSVESFYICEFLAFSCAYMFTFLCIPNFLLQNKIWCQWCNLKYELNKVVEMADLLL